MDKGITVNDNNTNDKLTLLMFTGGIYQEVDGRYFCTYLMSNGKEIYSDDVYYENEEDAWRDINELDKAPVDLYETET